MLRRAFEILGSLIVILALFYLYTLWERQNEYEEVLNHYNDENEFNNLNEFEIELSSEYVYHESVADEINVGDLLHQLNNYNTLSNYTEVKYEQSNGVIPTLQLTNVLQDEKNSDTIFELDFLIHITKLGEPPFLNRLSKTQVFNANKWKPILYYSYAEYSAANGNTILFPVQLDEQEFSHDNYSIYTEYFKRINGNTYFLKGIKGKIVVSLMSRELEDFQLVFFEDESSDKLDGEQHILWEWEQ